MKNIPILNTIPILNKIPILGIIPIIGLVIILVLASSYSFAANSGTFCNERNRVVEFVCGMTPGGAGWVAQPNGCFHRETGQYCREDIRPPAPRPPDYGPGVVCKAQDRGWEEHRGGHYSCGECMRAHGQCIETCAQQNFQCEAQGIDYRGNVLRFVGEARDQYRAQDQAMRNCSNNARSCRIVVCNNQEQVVSRRSCR